MGTLYNTGKTVYVDYFFQIFEKLKSLSSNSLGKAKTTLPLNNYFEPCKIRLVKRGPFRGRAPTVRFFKSLWVASKTQHLPSYNNTRKLS